jgi:hypothetical protein
MRNAAVGVILAILVVASLGAGYLAGNAERNTETVTSVSTSTLTSRQTVTSTSISTSTEVAPFVPDAATAVGSNGTSGIDLVLGVNATNLKVGQRLGVEVSLFNPLPSADSVPIFTANDWPWGHPGQDNFSGVPVIFGGPCDPYPFVRAVVLEGDYTPQELPSAANSSLFWQCAEGEVPENMTFSPESSLANVTVSGNVALAPRVMSISFTTDGSWDLSNFSRQVNQPVICLPCQNPPIAAPFVPGAYTLAVSDQWGQVAVLHFDVEDYSGEVASSLSDAVGYLIGVGSFDPGIRLIPETPGSTTYWLYSDNYLASLALEQYGRGNATITSYAKEISTSLASYVILDHLSDAVNQYMALNASVPCEFNASQNYAIGSVNAAKIMATFNNGRGRSRGTSTPTSRSSAPSASTGRETPTGRWRRTTLEGRCSTDSVSTTRSSPTPARTRGSIRRSSSPSTSMRARSCTSPSIRRLSRFCFRCRPREAGSTRDTTRASPMRVLRRTPRRPAWRSWHSMRSRIPWRRRNEPLCMANALSLLPTRAEALGRAGKRINRAWVNFAWRSS